MKKFLAELIGTFVLVFGGCGSAVLAGDKIGFLGLSIAFGLTLLTMAYGIASVVYSVIETESPRIRHTRGRKRAP